MQHEAALAVCSVAANNAEHTSAIVSAGAIPPLVRLLESTDKDVQVRASMLGWCMHVA